MIEVLRPILSLIVPQMMRPRPLKIAKKTPIAMPPAAPATAAVTPLAFSASGGKSFIKPMLIRPALAPHANVSRIKKYDAVRSISFDVKFAVPAAGLPAADATGGAQPAGFQPAGGKAIQVPPMSTSTSQIAP